MDFETLSDEDYSDLSGERKMLERLRQVAEYVAATEMKIVSPWEDHLYFPDAEMDEAAALQDQGTSVAVATGPPKKVLEAKRVFPKFWPGDKIRVNVRVIEGNRIRLQTYLGVCIARSGSGLDESFTVRKVSNGEGVERVFSLYSPLLESIEVVRRGKSARVAETTNARSRALNDESPSVIAAQKAAVQAYKDKAKAAEAAADAAADAAEASETYD